MRFHYFMSLLLHKKHHIVPERVSVVLGDFVAYSLQYCAGFSVISRTEGDDARVYAKENLDVGNVYQFSLGVPRNFSSFFVHDLFASTLSLYYLGSLGSLRVCHGTLIFEQSKSIHLNLNFCIFILC